MGDLPGGGGAAAAELKPLTSSSAGPKPSPENWAVADRAAREIIRKVQPTCVSEERRKAVVHYIQRLIRSCLGVEVFSYGSVPLKTYLPDGDIDLTVFGGMEDTIADDMKTVLEEEERNTSAEFVVKDVQLVRAEVKIVKCIVQDIVVDVSFNQIGGLCTLCFLEQVDRAIGQDHLFKHSIILIKAWCYYESRILGAHHGLISTYALETLVLYIFHLYHSTLDGPLAVLYKFLDYFSKFCWETYYITLDGPIQLSSLPPVVELPEDCDRELLLNKEFLNYCVRMFSVPYRDNESSRGFQHKFFNIVDPLKDINNLGRSVSKGNYYRIRSAFSYGAKKLAQILVQPQHSIAYELRKFFANTMERHGGGPRPDVLDIYQTTQDNFDEQAVRESDDLTISRLDALKISADSSNSQTSSPVFAPHLFFSKSKRHDSEKHLVDQDDVFRDTPTDLAGEFDAYMQYLSYGRTCCEYGVGMHSLPMPPFANPSYQSNGMWDNVLPPLHYKQNGFSHQHQNNFHPNAAMYPMPPVLIPAIPYWEDVPKSRGVGTYFPNMAVPYQAYRPKARNQVQIRSPRNNGRNEASAVAVVSSSDSHVPFSPTPTPNQNGYHNANAPEEVAELEEISRPVPSSPRIISGVQKSSKGKDRILLTSSAYHLKDDGDFPPLSM